MAKEWVEILKNSLGVNKAIDTPEHLEAFSRDESGIEERYMPDVVVHPENSSDVVKTVKFAHERGIPIVPRGGGSGLSGGAIPVLGGIIVVFDKMNRILEINPESLTARVEPGVITGEFQRLVESQGLFYPPDPASLDICTLGGNVAENASGPRTLKYGVTQHYVLELETVFPDGSRVRIGKPVRKWVVGYNLLGLLVGSEGTLGIFTEITLRLIPKPNVVITALLPFEDEVKASRGVSEILKGGILPRTLEFLDKRALEIVKDKILEGVPRETGSILILELDGDNEDNLLKTLERGAEIAMKCGAFDVLVARTSREKDRLWKGRRELYTVLEERYERVRSEDLVVPRERFPSLVKEVYRIESGTGISFCTFGHAGDGNLHANLLYSERDLKDGKVEEAIRRLYRTTIELGGTISGEHGVGVLKRPYISMEQPAFLIELQRKVKNLIDPKGIMNPEKIFPMGEKQ